MQMYHTLSTLEELGCVLKILFAFLLGATIGWEREVSGKDAGIRTYGFIAAGACAFSVLSGVFLGDPSRMISNIIVGISFVAGGVIWRSNTAMGTTHGLTTAASLWLTASLGIMISAELYILGIFTTAIALSALHLPASNVWKKYFGEAESVDTL